jgi:hypothetical protein
VARLLYFLFGLLALGSATAAEQRGWLLARPTELQNVPKSIRDNPGAWRSLYAGAPRTFGGK